MNKDRDSKKDDWARFERAVDVALKTPAIRKPKGGKKPKKAAKKKS